MRTLNVFDAHLTETFRQRILFREITDMLQTHPLAADNDVGLK